SPVKEIISTNPGFMVEKGTSIIFLIILILFASTWFIKYPDIVTTSATLSLVNAPKPIVSKQTGKLAQLNIQNGAAVKEGTIIGKIESTANVHDILMLENKLSHFNGDTILDFQQLTFNQLGELQPDFQQFIQEYIQYKNFAKE